jgi:hypothetical protein
MEIRNDLKAVVLTLFFTIACWPFDRGANASETGKEPRRPNFFFPLTDGELDNPRDDSGETPNLGSDLAIENR